jgi:hypothetical protein
MICFVNFTKFCEAEVVINNLKMLINCIKKYKDFVELNED